MFSLAARLGATVAMNLWATAPAFWGEVKCGFC